MHKSKTKDEVNTVRVKTDGRGAGDRQRVCVCVRAH